MLMDVARRARFSVEVTVKPDRTCRERLDLPGTRLSPEKAYNNRRPSSARVHPPVVDPPSSNLRDLRASAVNSPADRAQTTLGLTNGFAAYFMWGLVPLYFRQIGHVPPGVILSHRIVWSVLLLAAVVAVRRRWADVRRIVADRRTLGLLAVATLLLAANWYLFIWAVEHRLVKEASLGYFINPLVNVALGAAFLRERFRRGQLVGLGLAAVGVTVLTASRGHLPWIALALAASFGGYGLIRKVTDVPPTTGLLVETAILLPIVGTYFALHGLAADAWGGPVLRTYVLLALAGVVTVVPLLCFGAAARRLRLSTLGLLQYVGPTCQFLLAVLLFDEPLHRGETIGFAVIWAACAVYSLDSLRARRAPTVDPPE